MHSWLQTLAHSALPVGIWTGWMLTRPAPNDIVVPRSEYWRKGPDPERYQQNPKNMQVASLAFIGTFLLAGVAVAFDLMGTDYPLWARVLVGTGAPFGIGVGIGAISFARILRK